MKMNVMKTSDHGKASFDTARIVCMINRFCAYVRFLNGSDQSGISFVDENTFLGHEENYKSSCAAKAQEALEIHRWKENWIGRNQEIRFRAIKAMDRLGNLVDPHQKTRFRNNLNPERKEYRKDAERALYDIFKSKGKEEEAAAFAEAVSVFGGHYDTISGLFFIKNRMEYLPVRTTFFEESFHLLGIDYKLSYQCSWENYCGFIDLVGEIQTIMQDVIPDVVIRLIDAHSFLWIIRQDRFREWNPDEETETVIERATEEYLEKKAAGRGEKRNRLVSSYSRSAEVVRLTKERAKGVCELCRKPAPFLDRKGQPYLETHHVVWLSRGGKDSTENTVALCPNCHTRIHVLDDPGDTEKLKEQ